jgi:hypothetical protein
VIGKSAELAFIVMGTAESVLYSLSGESDERLRYNKEPVLSTVECEMRRDGTFGVSRDSEGGV